MLLLDNESFVNKLLNYINFYSDTNLNSKLYLFKVINIFKNYKNNKKIHNLLMLLILPNEITKEIYEYVNYINLHDLITLDESMLFKFENIEKYRLSSKLELDCNNESLFYQCKCGSKEIKIREKQMRSLDEPSTIIMRCVKCGNKWVSKY